MVSGWHIVHLPVRLRGSTRTWQVVDEVVVSWKELRVEGFLLAPRPFGSWFLAGDDRIVRVTATGLEVPSVQAAQRMTRRWRRQTVAAQRAYRNGAVVDQWGRLHGRLKDFFFDEKSLSLTFLVVSRGIVGDLLSGARLVPVSEVTEIQPGTIKIYAPGEPFPMR